MQVLQPQSRHPGQRKQHFFLRIGTHLIEVDPEQTRLSSLSKRPEDAMQVLIRCALPSTHITSNQHIDFELCGVQKVAPCDERDGEPATGRRQKTASPPRHPAEHEYQSDTLSTKPAREGEKATFFCVV